MRASKRHLLWLLPALLASLVVYGGGPSTAEEAPGVAPAQARGHVNYYPGRRLIRSVRAAHQALPDTPRSFQRYIGARGAKAYHDAPRGCRKYAGARVDAYHTRGYAHGFVGTCDGGIEVYRFVHHRWRRIIGTQDVYSCAVLQRNRVPKSVLGRGVVYCAKRSGDIVKYHHR